MATITTRVQGDSPKGSPLTNAEVDNNFINLNTDKYESGDTPTFGQTIIEHSDYDALYVKRTNTASTTIIMHNSANVGGSIQADSNGLRLYHYNNGVFKKGFDVANTEIVVNEDDLDRDFRVESSGSTHALYVDGGSNIVYARGSSGEQATRNSSGSRVSPLVQFHVNNMMSVGAYSYLGQGHNNTGNLAFNMTPDQSGNYYPQWAEQASAGGAIIRMPSGGNGGLDIYTKRFGEDYSSFTLATASHALRIPDTGGVILNEDDRAVDFRVESSGNSNMLLVDGTDNRVGIGYGSPQTTLHVFHPINEGIRLQSPTANNSLGAENRIDFHMSNEVSQATGNPAARVASYLERNNNGYGLKFAVRQDASTFSTLMTLSPDMEVGIGTTTPGAELHVYKSSGDSDIFAETGGSGKASLYLKNSENTFRIYTDNSELVFYDNTDARETIKIDTHGNLVLKEDLIGAGAGPSMSDMRGVFANAANEENHFMHPFLNNSWGHFVERGGTISVVGLSGGVPSQANLARAFHANANNVGIYNSDYAADTIDIIMTDVPTNFTYGSYGSVSFGNSGWAPVSVTVYISTDNGSTWSQQYTSSATKTNHSWYWSTGGTQTNALKITLGRPSNNSYLRLNNICVYNYVGHGTEQYHLPRRGGQLFGGLTVNEENESTEDFRVESNTNSNMLFVDSDQDKVLINGSGSAVGTLHVYGETTNGNLTGVTPSNIPFVVSNSDNGYGTMINQLGTGVGEIQSRRTFTQTYYGLSLSPYGGGVVINENHAASGDFRVESDSNTNMIYVDAADNHVNIGTATDLGGTFNVNGLTVLSNGQREYHNLYVDPRGVGDGTYTGYLLLCRAYPGSGTTSKAALQGVIQSTRGGTGSGNTNGVARVMVAQAYNNDMATCDFMGNSESYGKGLFTVVYDGTKYIAMRYNSVGGGPDNGIYFTGRIIGASVGDDNILKMKRNTEVTEVTEYGNGTLNGQYHNVTVMNQQGIEADFRVESNNNSHAIFVDSSAGTVNFNYGSGDKPANAGGVQLQLGNSSNASQIYFDGTTTNKGSVAGGLNDDFAIFTQTGAGAFSERLKIKNNGYRSVNGVMEYYKTLYLSGSSSYTFDIDVKVTNGTGGIYEVFAGFTHYGSAYAAVLKQIIAHRSNIQADVVVVDTITNYSTATSGAWSVSYVDGDTIRLTKSAGTYGGAGYGYILVRGHE